MTSLLAIGPVLCVAAVCAALGVSRATYYRHRKGAPGDQHPPPAMAMPVQASGAPAVAAELGEPPSGTEVAAPAVLEAPSASEAAPAAPVVAERAVTPSVVAAGATMTSEALLPAVGKLHAAVVPRSSKLVPRALSAQERGTVLALLNGRRFCDMSPAEVYATLLDEGIYHCSERTMYRILFANAEVKERRDQRRHPVYAAPELLATKPNQVWTWDITKLRGPGKGEYFHLYVILDLYSRYVVGWMVSASESAEQAEQFIDATCARHAILRGQLTVHADRGSSMKSQAVALLLADLGVIKSHSRPSVSDDNPYSEAQFKTLKYRPDFPDRFGSLADARAHCQRFFTWYNTEHHHVGIGLLTPHDVFTGHAEDVITKRAAVLDVAYAGHHERFVNKRPQPLPLPGAVWINRPKNVTTALANPTDDIKIGNARSVSTSENPIVDIGIAHLGGVSASERPIV